MSDPILAAGARQLAAEVRAEVIRGADNPDFFSTLPTAELQVTLRGTPNLAIDTLLNTGAVRVDFDHRRIYRDAFWKGSFATDSLLGDPAEPVRNFTGGSFWKRFDHLQDGVATGYVVNYEISALPGLPEVRAVPYPDDRRLYIRKGHEVLLLSYTNDPYRLVYDTIKVIDPQNAIGVMHLGKFPLGMEVATFVLARHNYPFLNMSIPDHEMLWDDPHAGLPAPEKLAGTRWEGNLIFVRTPDTSLVNQSTPVPLLMTFHHREARLTAECRIGVIAFTHELDAQTLAKEMRTIGSDIILGRWAARSLDSQASAELASLLFAGSDFSPLYFVLERQAQ